MTTRGFTAILHTGINSSLCVNLEYRLLLYPIRTAFFASLSNKNPNNSIAKYKTIQTLRTTQTLLGSRILGF